MTSQTTTTKTTKTTEAPAPTPADKLNQDLAAKRARVAAKAGDRLERLRDRTVRATDAREIRQEAARDRAAATLERAKIAADIRQSAEARALRVQRTRTLTLAVLLPVLVAFAAWSTTGVHAGVTAMIGIDSDSPMWWMLWLLEPALITAVGWIIIARSRLETSGGALPSDEAGPIMWGCLLVSIVLNAIGHWPSPISWNGVGSLLAHSLGPVGAATTAHLIGIIESAITRAKPTEGPGVKTLAELTVNAQKSAQKSPETTSESASEPAPADRSRAPERALDVPAGATRLAVAECCRPAPGAAPEPAQEPAQKTPRSTDDQGKDTNSEVEPAPAPKPAPKPRADRGRKVPEAAKPAQKSARQMTPEELADRLAELIADPTSEVTEKSTLAAIQKALGVGFQKAKSAYAIYQERTETLVLPGQLSVVDASHEAANAA